MKQLLQGLLAAAILMMSACGGGGDSTPQPQPQPQGIGPAGGTLSGPGGAQVVVPANALAQTVDIQIAQSSAGAPALPAGMSTAGEVFAFTPHGTTFSVPASVTIPFDPARLPAGKTPTLLKTDAQGQWQTVAGASVNGSMLTGAVGSFSWLAAAVTGSALQVMSSNPADAQGPLTIADVTTSVSDDNGVPMLRVTATGSTASGLPARIEVTFVQSSGAGPIVVFTWGTSSNTVYCTSGANPCSGTTVQVSGATSGRIDFVNQLLNLGGSSSGGHAVLSGSLAY